MVWPDSWETPLLERIPALERNLIEHAYQLQADAVARQTATPWQSTSGWSSASAKIRSALGSIGSGFVASPDRSGGDRFTPTEPIRMQGRFRYSARIFAAFPVQTRHALTEIEDGFAWIRYRTERLAALRDLCRKTASSSY